MPRAGAKCSHQLYKVWRKQRCFPYLLTSPRQTECGLHFVLGPHRAAAPLALCSAVLTGPGQSRPCCLLKVLLDTSSRQPGISLLQMLCAMHFSFSLLLQKMKSLCIILLNATALARGSATGLVCLSLAMAYCSKNMRLLGFLEKGVARLKFRQ